ncbi:hypothetical protein SELMODRAFT_428162 [Selaginella moellendorffii]|uniref:DUF4110 domain-containing protein n=1 Tax=Selaginella moellendorffii TaxID=88036 RepID=D8T1Y4_SELML|nr:hypothetical protein SELMODRAFT_428162 [Selaginella moellendorffii]
MSELNDARLISKGTDKEDDGKVVKKKDVELGLADSQQTPLPGEALRDFFSWTIMYWHLTITSNTLERSSGRMDLNWQRHATENLNPSLTSLRDLKPTTTPKRRQPNLPKSAARRNDKMTVIIRGMAGSRHLASDVTLAAASVTVDCRAPSCTVGSPQSFAGT